MLKAVEGGSFNPAKASNQSPSEKPLPPHAKERAGSEAQPVLQDRVSLGGGDSGLMTYSREVSSEVLSGQFLLLRNLVAKTLQDQEASFSLAINGQMKGIEDLTPTEAQELVAEDGYFGVKQTSDRIVEFAIGATGGDPGRLDAILQGVEQGFREAEKAFGGSLPEISYQTYDAIREKLEQWRGSFQN
ncbi:MAG: hypothetical protein Q8R97_11415 [Brevundimonas sp.]|nr:hypothetical protein [Brevundimonas sp.]